MRVLRAICFGSMAFVLSMFAFFAASLGLLFDPHGGRIGNAVGRLWSRALLAVAGARVTVVGAERWAPREPRVLVANHASYLDIPAMMVAFPGQVRIIARRNLVRVPFVGWYLALGGHFRIDREDPRQALRLLEDVSRRMHRYRLSALLYPEGTRSLDGRLAPLKAGAFFLPVSAGVAVQPVAILGTRDILPKGAWFPLRSGPVEVRVGEPIPLPAGEPSVARKDLAVRARAALLSLGVPE